MTMTNGAADPASGLAWIDLKRTARTTGLLYLAFFITGILGSMVVRGRLFVADDPQGTLSNLVAHDSLARTGIALELGIALTQAVTAVWFYRLLRGVDRVAAGTLTAFGLVNAVAILGSAAVLATAREVAHDGSLAVTGGQASTTQLLYVVSGHVWGVAAVFFGLWLIPMGWLAIRSGWFPRLLGWLLIGAGICYVISAFSSYLFKGGELATQLLTIPSIVGEVWIMAHLVIVGVRRRAVLTPSAGPWAE
ncbi:MAG TPA: DUF4386 domain-containing protein [Propionicimonas sp.]|jgi:hypothetical protein